MQEKNEREKIIERARGLADEMNFSVCARRGDLRVFVWKFLFLFLFLFLFGGWGCWCVRCSERRRIFVLCEYLRVFECVSLDEK